MTKMTLTDMMTRNYSQMNMRMTMPCNSARTVTRKFLTMGLALLMLLAMPSILLAADQTITDARDPADFSAWSPSTGNYINAFNLASSGNGQRTVTSLTVTTTGTANIAAVEVRDATGATTYGSDSAPSGNDWVITGLSLDPTKNANADYRIYVDIVGGASGTVTAYVTAFVTGGGNLGVSDVAGTTITGFTAGCSTVNPSISLSGGQTIGASQTAAYTITLTNNDSAACANTNFTVAVQAGGDTGNTASFVTPSVTNPGSCVINLAPQATDSTSCDLEVTSNGSPTDGHIMNTVIEVTSGTHSAQTANVDTTISAGGSAGCDSCHKYAPVDGARDLNTGDFLGSHDVHAAGASWLVPTHIADCTTCHTDTTTGETDTAHRRGNIILAASIGPGGSYSKGTSFAQDNNPTMGTCSITNCHGSGATPTWGGGAMTCTSCHNDGEGNAYPETGTTFRTVAAIGAHTTHMEATTGMMNGGVVCIDCHTNYTNESDANHFDTSSPADVPFPGGSDAYLNSTAGANFNGGTAECTNIYCHGANMPGGSTDGTNTTPLWTDNWSGCTTSCHGLPPTPAGTHSGYTFPGDCNGCHDTVNTSGAIVIVNQHINGTVEVAGCTGCHGSDPKEYPPLSGWGSNRSTANGVGAHVTHMEATNTLMTKEDVGGDSDDWCAECHTNTRGAGGHNDGYPGEVSFANAVEAKYGSTAASFTSEDGNPDTGVGGNCTVYCHGANMPNNDTAGSNRFPDWGDSLSGCGTCHGAPPNTGGHSGGEALTDCVGCHPDTVNASGAISDNTKHINGIAEVSASCTGCHSSSAHVSGVGAGSPHLKLVRGGADQACEACHPGNLRGAQHAKNADANVVLIANNTNLGISYVDGVNGYNGDNGIVLGGDNTVGTTEAEICWNCHDDSTPDISEWDGSSATYDYGSVTNNDLNWFTTTWSSANFNYKNGGLTTRIATVSNASNNPSTHGTKGGSTGVDQESEIGCTYCHDVHDANKATGDSFSGPPYLRGSWKSSPYYEDGAPGRYTGTGGSGTSTWQGTFGAVPRGSAATNNGMGGYWIDQNSGNPNNGTYATHAGLCTLCHGDGNGTPAETADRTSIEGNTNGWVGHINVVAGGSKNRTSNIYAQNGRNGDGTWDGGMWMGAQNSTGQGGTRYYSYRSDREPWVAPTIGSDYTYNNFAWSAVTMNNTTTDQNMHNFTCSKCHNPHASRLPRLMITNCLDIARNTWDDAYTNATNMDSWDGSNAGAPNANVNYGTGEHAYSSTAQNCHRYNTLQSSATGENGWNTVTPWQ